MSSAAQPPPAPATARRTGVPWKVGLVLVLTAVCLGWFLWGLDLGETWHALAGYHLWILIPVYLLSLVTLVVRTARFQLLVDHPVGFKGMFSVMAVGFLAIGVMPLRLGELVRPYLLWENHRVPVGTSAAAVVLERLLDLAALLVLLLLASVLVDLPPSGLAVGGVDLMQLGIRGVGGAVAVGLVAGVALGVAGPAGVDLLSGVARRVSPGLGSLLESLGGRFVDGFRVLVSRPGRGLGALGLTAVTWTIMTGATWVVMQGFDALEPDAGMVVLNWAATMTGNMLPTPGSVGGFEAASAGSLVVLGVDKELASAYALLNHGLILLFNVSVGGVLLLVEGWSLVAVVRSSRTLGGDDG